ncbi:hypothetical protein [Micromonospora sp. NPDC093277]|uniref:hypothetical protein n=1 Tax=Micromonospora sp. NPDC093277 TaxID=3364291 RepID=UPI0037F4AC63
MQPVGPYRFTEALGVCQVGTAWWAVDGQDRLVTVAMLDGAAATDQPWREAFANAANAMALTAGGQRYVNADFAAAKPWVAYPSEEGMGAQRLFQTLGMDLHPAESEAEVLIPETGTVAEPPEPVSGVPTSGTPSPTSGAPLPWAMHAAVPQQVSSPPQPVSPAPQQVSPAPLPEQAQPVSLPPQDPFTSPVPRITPSEPPRRRIAPVDGPPRRSRVWLQAVVALVLLLGGGAIGFGWGSSRGGTPEPSPTPSLAVYEATQFSINKSKFDGALAQLAEPWLTRMGGCAADTDTGGPDLPPDEQRHVFCRYGGVSVHFALYDSPAKEDAARAYRGQLSLTGTALAPGLREATRTKGGVTGAAGSYVEYAFKSGDDRPMCGIWWDRDDSVGAFYLETLCEAGIAGNWDALRDLWRRSS